MRLTPRAAASAGRPSVAREAARLVASSPLERVPDALIAATGAALDVPLVTNDRRPARSGAVAAVLVSEYA